MSKYFVNIIKTPLGVEFSHSDDNESLIVENVVKDSIGNKLGINVDDILIAINGHSILNINSKIAFHLFCKQSVPFTATFETLEKEEIISSLDYVENDSDPSDSEQHLDYINNLSDANSERSLSQTPVPTISNCSYNNHQVTGSMKAHYGSIINENIFNYYLEKEYSNFFDVFGKYNEMNSNKYMISSNAFYTGYHEFTIKILKCDVDRVEIGVISNLNAKINVDINDGICGTPKFGARAVYGNVLETNQAYYASYNKNNTIRCKKNLLSSHQIGWCSESIVTVKLDLDKGNIKFYLNNKKVRKTISVARNLIYHPIISYFGDCEYTLINYK